MYMCIVFLQGDHEHEPKWKICLKSLCFLIFGVAAVTIFSDPMVDALTALADPDNSKHQLESGKKGQHIPIPG